MSSCQKFFERGAGEIFLSKSFPRVSHTILVLRDDAGEGDHECQKQEGGGQDDVPGADQKADTHVTRHDDCVDEDDDTPEFLLLVRKESEESGGECQQNGDNGEYVRGGEAV